MCVCVPNMKVQLGGTLTVVIGSTVLEGDVITLFNFASSQGQFDEIALDSGDGCTYEGHALYTAVSLSFVVDTVSCSSAIEAIRVSSFFLR